MGALGSGDLLLPPPPSGLFLEEGLSSILEMTDMQAIKT